MVQNLRIPLEDRKGVGHLVVIVHPTALAQDILVLPVDFRELVNIRFQFLNILIRQHHVLDVGNEAPDLFDLTVLRVLVVHRLIDRAYQVNQLSVLCHQIKRHTAHMIPAKIVNDLGRDAVDGPKLQILC